MARRPPDKTVLDEVRKLKASLTPSQFQPLHTGLGLGKVRPVASKPGRVPMMPEHLPELPPDFAEPLQPAMAPQSSERYSPSSVGSQIPPPPPGVSKKASRPVEQQRLPHQPGRIGWGGRILHAALDLTVVLLTLGAGALGLDMWASGTSLPATWLEWQRTLPVLIVLELGPLRSVLGILILFLIYWLFFRMVAGATIGESLMRSTRSRRLSSK